MPDRCRGTTKDGKPCGAKPLPGSELCPWHDPAWEGRRQEWSKKGGRGKSNEARARKRLAGDVRDRTDVKARLMLALAKVEEGNLEPGSANAMANLARAIATVAGVADFEGQLAELRHEVAALSKAGAPDADRTRHL
jgi:hypothetical protein